MEANLSLLLITGGVFISAAGLYLIKKQSQQRIQDEDMTTYRLQRQTEEARMVAKELNNLMSIATMTASGMIDKLQEKIVTAEELTEQIAIANQRAHVYAKAAEAAQVPNVAEAKHAQKAEQKVDTPTPAPNVPFQPFYAKEYSRHNKKNPVAAAKPANQVTDSLAKAKEFLSQIDQGDPGTWSKEQRYNQIPELLKLGLSELEIAQLLDLGQVEVQLVTKLKKAN